MCCKILALVVGLLPGVDGADVGAVAPSSPPGTEALPAAAAPASDATPVAAAPSPDVPPANTVLVLPVRAIGPVAEEAALATTLIAERLAAAGDAVTVVTLEDIRAVLDVEAAQQALACDQESCIAEVGRLSRAPRALSSSLGKVGAKFVLSASLVDTQRAQSLAKASREVASLEELLQVIPQLVAEVLGVEAVAAAGFRLAPGAKVSLAVVNLEARGIGVDDAENLTQVLAGELEAVEGASVISRDDVAALLEAEAARQALGCTSDMSCLAEIGGALGVDKLVVGTVGKLGGSHVISLRLIDVQQVRVDSRVSEAMSGQREQLLAAMRWSARRLLGVADESRPGGLAVAGNELGASVWVDEQQVGELPLRPLTDLRPGRHALRVAKEDFFDFRTDVYVEPGGTTAVWAELEETPDKWYQRWWVWAAVGAAVAAGVGIGVGVYFDQATQFPRTVGGAHPL